MTSHPETMTKTPADNVPFTLQPPDVHRRAVRPKEPLHSLLVEAPFESLAYLHQKLVDFQDDSALEDLYPNVGLTRREYLEQVILAMDTRERYLGYRG